MVVPLLPVTRVAAKTTRGRKLAQLMANHVLGNVDRDEFVSVMNCHRMTHEVGGNHRCPSPCLNDTLLATFVHGENFLLE